MGVKSIFAEEGYINTVKGQLLCYKMGDLSHIANLICSYGSFLSFCTSWIILFCLHLWIMSRRGMNSGTEVFEGCKNYCNT